MCLYHFGIIEINNKDFVIIQFITFINSLFYEYVVIYGWWFRSKSKHFFLWQFIMYPELVKLYSGM